MYMLLCRGGYAVPIKPGKMELCGISATVLAPASTSELSLVDTDSGIPEVASTENTEVLVHLKGTANVNGHLTEFFKEPITIRKGLSVAYADNILAGSIIAYVR